jgi:alkylation response protein AidB-like acyl-CoA dehydrogenase
MPYALTEDQLVIQDQIRRVAREKVAPRAHAIDKTGEYPQDMFEMLKDLGWFALPFPEEYGGTGSTMAACIAVEELNRVCYNTAYLLVLQWIPFEAIHAAGNDEQQSRFLPDLAAGKIRAAFSLTEPQSGSDVSGIKTRAKRTEGGYTLNGAKIWCSSSDVADIVLVAAKIVEEDGTTSGINLFILEKGMKGFTVGAKEDKMGARGVAACALFFDNVFIPTANRLGPEGSAGFKSVMEALNRGRPIVSSRAVGLAQGAIDHAADFVKQRFAFGRNVSEFQGVRWMLADMVTQTEAARQMVYRNASMIDQGMSGAELASMSAMTKLFATDTAMRVATDAVQLFGAAGISNEYPINRYFRNAKVLQIIEGTNQIQRNIISDNLLGRMGRKQ